MYGKTCQNKSIFFKTNGKIKTFYDKQNPKEFKTTKPALQMILKRVLYIEEEDYATRKMQEE
jgi:hypothetical protein